MPRQLASITSSPDALLTESRLRELCLNFLDRCIYNDLPQYLIRISDMRLYSRDELLENFRPLVENMYIDVREAKTAIKKWGYDGDVKLLYQKKIRDLLRFAIFSHRWGSKEPTFRDVSSKIYGDKPPPTGPGWEKLLRFCEKAQEFGCEYVWTDTCCINKESSAELEEAIRSMYRWYDDAFVCIIYLAMSSSIEDFRREPWFTRGWTLQELLAPRNIRMYGKDWTPICPREEENTPALPLQHSSPSPQSWQPRSPPDYLPNDKRSTHMLEAISKVTGIDVEYIREFKPTEVSLSEKMRWASKRKTTRVEDTAYSLLGIFNVSMPIAYGEGNMAFRRLLDVIAQQSQDPSFFAWSGWNSDHSSALPASPSAFSTKVTAPGGGDRAYTIQKLGVQVNLLLVQVQVHESDYHYTLQPVDADLSQIITIPTRLRRRPNVFSGDKCALGVVNFDQQSHPNDDNDDRSILFAGRRYFCMLIKSPVASLPRTFGQPSLKLDTGDVLPMIECKQDYRAHPTTVCLVHSLGSRT